MRSGKYAIIARSRVRTLAGACAAAVVLSGVAAFGVTGPAALAASEYPRPAITVAGGNSVIAVQTSGDGLRFYWNQHGTSTWRGEQVAANGTTFSAPVIAQDGNGVVIAVQGRDNSLDFYWALNGTSTWHGRMIAGAGTTYSAPSVASNGGAANVVAEGPGNTLDFYWNLNGTPAWHSELVAGVDTTYSAPLVIGNDGSANVVAEGPGKSLDFYWQQNGTTRWHLQPVPDSFILGPLAMTADTDGSTDGVDVIAIGGFGELINYSNTSGSWQSFSVLGNPLTPRGLVGSAPTVTRNNGSENLAMFGSLGDLDFYWQDSNGIFQQEIVAAAGVN